MSKGKIIAGLLVTLLLVSLPFIYNRTLGAENNQQSETPQEVTASEVLNFNDLVVLISNNLMELDYGLWLSNKELPNNRYLLHVKLPRYNVSLKVREEILERIENVINEHNFDRQNFLIKVTSYIDTAEQSSPQKQEELDTFYMKLNKDGGFFEQVGKELDKAGYSYEAGYSIVGMVYSPNEVSLQIIAENEAVTEQKQVEINRIFKGQITKFKLDGVVTVNAIHISELNDS
ncbi:hypothetical protein [Lysinibacillus odysseyi]|uniref:Uncharacterized protein n=1 Tax=Lysinibacillus odysseyi 34hs-1 = NBRC 100172 TaxID=1220589 RepID=A0A0A3J0Y0_9BACI|nr:hypothetical protein [Lysinibacillus odysseyi]KGR88793.1 hypothetical protein CD32_01025 [Lysinibacillus odysseyi 34hs-1 = NBRC 100172]